MYILQEINHVFFALNQNNYAKFLIVYLNSLLRVEESHPGLVDEFKKGSFGIRRTEKPHSRIPIDLTLKQTINNHMARTMTDVVNLSDNFESRQRWVAIHSLRCKLISVTMERCNLRKKQDVTQDLTKSSLTSCAKNLEKLLNCLKERTNPFGDSIDKSQLHNISSG